MLVHSRAAAMQPHFVNALCGENYIYMKRNEMFTF